tara:strand:- start:131 stop:961 length:831 start_codon:yes stop_codon:yes gene_type:complete
MAAPTFHISRFDPKSIERRRKKGSPPTCIFIGKRGTGKSTLVADILYYIRKIPGGVVMSATEEGNEFFQQHVPDICIFNEYKKEKVSEIVEGQRKAVKENKEKVNDIFLLLDDCMYDKKFLRSPDIRGIFMNGRHWKIMLMITMQYCMDLPPDLRTNVDYVFALRENVISTQKKLYNFFFGIFPEFNQFKQVFENFTEDFECLVLDNTSRSNRIEDCVFWYKAKPNRKFRACDKALWHYHKKNYNKEYWKTAEETEHKQNEKNRITIGVKREGKKK